MIKQIFLAGWDVRLNGDEECIRYITTQNTTEDVVKKLDCGLELVFEDGKLIEAFDYEEGSRFKRVLLADETGLSYIESTPNPILQIIENPTGLHQIGGEIPQDFSLPDSNCIVPFQYLGFINNEDPAFDWLPFTVHLTCPIFLNIEQVFLDYTNPSYPVLVNKEEVESVDTSYEEDLSQDSEIVFEAMRFNFEADLHSSEFGHAGLPIWTQYPSIPTCPKSGRLMKFLCQLQGGPKTQRSNVTAHDEFYQQYYDTLNFWGDGSLYVFFEPQSMMACYLIQNT